VLIIIASIISHMDTTLLYCISMSAKERIVAALYLIDNCSPELFWKQCANLLLDGRTMQPFNESVLEF
jgi:hypothetical protein